VLCLSHTTGYAILALSCLTRFSDRLVLAKEIADCTGIPLPYLSKILHAMRRNGLIDGKRGYRGGFSLARDASEMTLLEVAEAVEGKEWLPRCLIGLHTCDPQWNCPTHAFWSVERVRIEEELRRVTLADVAAFARLPGSSATCEGGQCGAPSSAGPGADPRRKSHGVKAKPPRSTVRGKRGKPIP